MEIFKKLEKAQSTMMDIRCVIRGVSNAADNLGFSNIAVQNISRKHIKLILDECKNVVAGWSNNRYNKYRAYLKILFGELIEHEATEVDPLARIKKRRTVKRIRSILCLKDRSRINEHLKKKHYTFWRFTQIFFHSGARETEMMLVRECDVDVLLQRFKITIKKGQVHIETWKTIKDIVMPVWIEIMNEAASGDYLFSNRLKPGVKPISAAQITRRWRTHIKAPVEKGGLGILADFYSLKHLHSTEVSELLSLSHAAMHNSHTSTKMLAEIYDVRYHDRQENLVKKLKNPF